jgi:hypothetical protein
MPGIVAPGINGFQANGRSVGNRVVFQRACASSHNRVTGVGRGDRGFMSSALFGSVCPRWRGSIQSPSEHTLQRAFVAGRFTLPNQPPEGGDCHMTSHRVQATSVPPERAVPRWAAEQPEGVSGLPPQAPPPRAPIGGPQCPGGGIIAAFVSRSASVSGSTEMLLASDGRVRPSVAEGQVGLSATNVPACLPVPRSGTPAGRARQGAYTRLSSHMHLSACTRPRSGRVHPRPGTRTRQVTR